MGFHFLHVSSINGPQNTSLVSDDAECDGQVQNEAFVVDERPTRHLVKPHALVVRVHYEGCQHSLLKHIQRAVDGTLAA